MSNREITFKWVAYALCTALLLFLHTLFLGGVRIWGVLPFLPPVLLSCVAAQEALRPAALFGLALGVCCDLLFSAPLPCLYTLSFTVSALLTAWLSMKVFQNTVLRALSGTLLTFIVTDLLCMLSFALRADAALVPMLSLAARETAVSLPLLIVFPLYFMIRRFFTF